MTRLLLSRTQLRQSRTDQAGDQPAEGAEDLVTDQPPGQEANAVTPGLTNHPEQAYVVTDAGLGLLAAWKKESGEEASE